MTQERVHTRYRDAVPYTTRDGTLIRELMHPAVHGNRGASLAEARLAPGRASHAHTHGATEELYHVTAGNGRMHLGDAWFPIAPGDTVRIPPGVAHQLENTGATDLCVLCICTPPYSHEDTTLL